MLVSSFAKGHEADLVTLLQAGHELGNHCERDRAYDEDSASSFAEAVDACSGLIEELQEKAGRQKQVRWFRAPHGRYTQEMHEVIEAKGLTNVMCDTYGSCPIVQDGEFVGKLLAKRAQAGSIILLHMPEKGLREWCLVALRLLLEGLRSRGLRAVTVGDLEACAAPTSAAADRVGSLIAADALAEGDILQPPNGFSVPNP
eukprot:TRINITY_DN45681_c0_g1_i1.p1 TRINITY_DN45681_c0_g1~~TRINITY_DN45681_c0_g1_i1.p1  ORF type:complete len:201 (-),score=26.69 TRINITY_DN45681_c0_g1_i1:29-631(-)